jgi:chitinase
MKKWRKTVGLIAALFGLVLTVLVNPGKAGIEIEKPWVAGYYVGYLSHLYPIEEIEWSGLTHLFIGRVMPKADGAVDLSLDLGMKGAPFVQSLIQAAHANGKKAIAFVGGEGTHKEWVSAASPTYRSRFVRNLAALVTQQGFDGIDLDWEPVEKRDHAPLLALIKDLRSTLPDAILTFPADGASNTNHPTDRSFYAQMAPYLDQINLMTYGVAATWEGWKSWHSSPLYHRDRETPYSISGTVREYLQAGVSPQKLGIGIGFFGTCWGVPVRAPNQAIRGGKVLAGDNDMSFRNIVQNYDSVDARRWDEIGRVPYLSFSKPTGPKRCTFVSYENERSITEKAQYIKNQGLGGMILWNINQGYVPSRPQGQRNPLLQATRKTLLTR